MSEDFSDRNTSYVAKRDSNIPFDDRDKVSTGREKAREKAVRKTVKSSESISVSAWKARSEKKETDVSR